jgi:hypothetical protein
LEKAMAQYGAPDYIRSDNGPEFIAKKVQQGLKDGMSRPSISTQAGHGKTDISKVFTVDFVMNVLVGSCCLAYARLESSLKIGDRIITRNDHIVDWAISARKSL